MKKFLFYSFIVAFVFVSCNNADTKSSSEATTEKKDSANIKEETVTYSLDTVKMNGFAAYDANKEGKRPIVLIVHEWWGLNDYPRMRAKQLAELGYFAMAVDLYGNGKVVETPTDAQTAAMPFYRNPQMAYQRLMAAAEKAKTFPRLTPAS